MEKYFELLDNAVDQLARKAAQGAAVIVDLERIERILNAAELKIDIAEKAV